ncbi:MAG: hypothetical protein Q9207_005916 [Kuettlingeria erythrocarpa]
MCLLKYTVPPISSTSQSSSIFSYVCHSCEIDTSSLSLQWLEPRVEAAHQHRHRNDIEILLLEKAPSALQRIPPVTRSQIQQIPIRSRKRPSPANPLAHLDDEDDESPGAVSSQACWRCSLTSWKEFIASRDGGAADKCLEKDRPPPAVSILKKFLVHIAHRPNRLQRMPTINTLQTYLKHFCSAFYKATGTIVTMEARDVLRRFIKSLHERYGIPKTQREKYIFVESDVDNLLRIMWTTDRCTFTHERQRIQLSLFLLIHAYCGARASTWIESSRERGTNRCLTYKDVGLHVRWDENGQKGLVMELTQRFTKGNHDVDTNWFRVPMLSSERLFHDPVAFFLALAFADNAIKGVTSIEQFWSIQPRGR